MTFKRALWLPVAVAGSVVNLAAAGFAALSAEPLHASIHGALALAFGWWAQRLRRIPAGRDGDARIEVLEGEVSDLQRRLSETQEGLDFAERLLAQRPESREVELQPRAEPARSSGNVRREREKGSDPTP